MSRTAGKWLAAALSLIVMLTGCSSVGVNQVSPTATVANATIVPASYYNDSKEETLCFIALTPEQETILREYIAANQNALAESKNTADKISICVLEPDTIGDYVQRYYKKEDESFFANYSLYQLLLGRANVMLMYETIANDLDPSENHVLLRIVGVNDKGELNHPYSKLYGSASWRREPARVDGKVTRVAFGRDGYKERPRFDSCGGLEVPSSIVRQRLPKPANSYSEYKKGMAGAYIAQSPSAADARDAANTTTGRCGYKSEKKDDDTYSYRSPYRYTSPYKPYTPYTYKVPRYR